MDAPFKLPVKLTPDYQLEDNTGKTIVPDFYYGQAKRGEWAAAQHQRNMAHFIEWWLNMYPRLITYLRKHPELLIESDEKPGVDGIKNGG